MEKKKVAAQKNTLGINDMAKHLGVASASARAKLRNAGIRATDGAYGWTSKKAMEADAAKMKPAEKAKPAKKAAVKAPAKKSAKKSAVPAKGSED